MRIQTLTNRHRHNRYLASLVTCLLMLFCAQAYAQKGCTPCKPDPANPGSGTQSCINPSGEVVIRKCNISEPPPPPQNSCFNPARDAVAVYRHKNYQGTCKVLTPGVYSNAAAMGFANDEASSIRMGPGAGAYLCSNESLEGNCDIVDRNVSDLDTTDVGNDQLSSIGVGRDGYRPCFITVYPPEVISNSLILGRGSRGPNCLRSANVQLVVRNDRFLRSDVTLATDYKTGNGVDLAASGSCTDFDGAGSRGVFTEIRVNGRKISQSHRIWPSQCTFTGR